MSRPIESIAARRFYRVSQVKEVRIERNERGVKFWLAGDGFTVEALDELFDGLMAIRSDFPTAHALIEVDDLCGSPLSPSQQREALPLVPKVADLIS